jgi:hypothetical protein
MKESKTIKTTFGTSLRPINLKEGIFILTCDSEVKIDSPLVEAVGTKKIFKAGSIVEGTLWQELSPKGKTRKVVMIPESLEGRYLIPKSDLKPTTQAEIDAKLAKEQVSTLNNKVEELLEDAKVEVKTVEKEIKEDSKGILDKEYFGFSGKQILVATLGVIILIKVFK